MNKNNHLSRRIQILRDTVARKIAAGEVIDRPFSVVRELMDNAIDAGAGTIDLHIEHGGLKRIRLIDDGSGMTREDLELCFLPHSTSKISNAEDIYKLHTLGFRGEALASIAACAKLTITSAVEGSSAHTLEVRNGSPLRIELSSGGRGTVIDVADLFYSMPGRKKFLKSTGAEGTACKRTFLEKAIPFPEIEFRFFVDGQLKLYFPPTNQKNRVLQAFQEQLSEDFLSEVESTAGRFRFHSVLSSPSRFRRDRRLIHVYVNKRRIQEYALLQAIQHAYEDLLPGGSFPMAFLFLDIDPELVDFNIHPAKREVKIKNLPEIHHQVVHSLKEHLNREYGQAPEWVPPAENHSLEYADFKTPNRENLDAWKSFARETAPSPSRAAAFPRSPHIPPAMEKENEAEEEIQFIGQVFDLFLIVQKKEQIYLIDQHAAHERIIFNKLAEGPRNVQQLLVPFAFEIESDEENLLESRLEDFNEVGITLKKQSRGNWLITHLPVRFAGLEHEIIMSIREQLTSAESFKTHLFADLACKAAIKDGEVLDHYSAGELAIQALKLPTPRCPHGRPIWLALSRNELFKAVGRI